MGKVVTDEQGEDTAGQFKRLITIALSNYEERVKAASGFGDRDTGHWLFVETAQVISREADMSGETVLNKADAVLSILENLAPQNAAEAMLAAQMVAAHECAMRCYMRGQCATGVEYSQTMLAQANKLSRTYAALHEALNKGRNKGRQVVTVVHQYVNAPNADQVNVAGNVSRGRGDRYESEDYSHAANGNAGDNGAPVIENRPEVWGENPFGQAMPGQDRARQEAVPDARRDKPRSAEG